MLFSWPSNRGSNETVGTKIRYVPGTGRVCRKAFHGKFLTQSMRLLLKSTLVFSSSVKVAGFSFPVNAPSQWSNIIAVGSNRLQRNRISGFYTMGPKRLGLEFAVYLYISAFIRAVNHSQLCRTTASGRPADCGG